MSYKTKDNKARSAPIITTLSTINKYKKWIDLYKKELLNQTNDLNIYKILKKNKVGLESDIQKISTPTDKNFLTRQDNITSYLQAITFNKESFKPIIVQDLENTSDNNIDNKLFTEHLKKIQNSLEKYNIFTPTKDQLFQVKCLLTCELSCTDIENLKYGKIESFESSLSEPIYNVPDYTAELNYYKIEAWKINNNKWIECEASNEPKTLLQDTSEYYEEHIKQTLEYINFIEEKCLSQWSERVFNATKTKGLIRPNEYYASQEPYITEITLSKITNFKDNATIVYTLLKSEYSEEYNKLLRATDDECDPDEAALSLLIGKRLSKNASIAFKALSYLIYREYYHGNASKLNSQSTVKASDFWNLCNIKKTKSGYDYKAKENMLEAIKELKESIIHESKRLFIVTSFVLNFSWEKDSQNISFQLDERFLVYKDQQDMSYYYSDIEGCNRLMNVTNNSEKAYWLHHYLEYALRSSTQTFNFSVLLDKAGLTKRYKVTKNHTQKQLYSFLEKMVSEKTLIDKWDLISSDSDKNGKFQLRNLRTWDNITNIDAKLKKTTKAKNFTK